MTQRIPNSFKLAATVVFAASTIIAVYYISKKYDEILWQKYIWLCDMEDRDAFRLLYRISNAIKIIRKDIDFLVLNRHTDNPDAVRHIAEIVSDIDFIFEELDAVRGSNNVRKRRKELVEVLTQYSEKLDKLVADLAETDEG